MTDESCTVAYSVLKYTTTTQHRVLTPRSAQAGPSNHQCRVKLSLCEVRSLSSRPLRFQRSLGKVPPTTTKKYHESTTRGSAVQTYHIHVPLVERTFSSVPCKKWPLALAVLLAFLQVTTIVEHPEGKQRSLDTVQAFKWHYNT